MSLKPHLLLSNDDGIHAPGILALLDVAREFGDTTVVAPDSAQSGMGHAISIGKPIRVYKESLPHGITGHAVSGTPADCIKIATGVVMDSAPDLILSGINHGSNSSASTIYSGTLSAAREGAMQDLPAIGFSLCHYSHEADLSAAKVVVRTVIELALRHGLPKGQCLNVNIPYLPIEQIKGIRITRQAMGRWVEEFEKRADPTGETYYWLTGKFKLMDHGDDTDEHALSHGYVAVTPLSHDLTAHHYRAPLSEWNWLLPTP